MNARTLEKIQKLLLRECSMWYGGNEIWHISSDNPVAIKNLQKMCSDPAFYGHIEKAEISERLALRGEYALELVIIEGSPIHKALSQISDKLRFNKRFAQAQAHAFSTSRALAGAIEQVIRYKEADDVFVIETESKPAFDHILRIAAAHEIQPEFSDDRIGKMIFHIEGETAAGFRQALEELSR